MNSSRHYSKPLKASCPVTRRLTRFLARGALIGLCKAVLFSRDIASDVATIVLTRAREAPRAGAVVFLQSGRGGFAER